MRRAVGKSAGYLPGAHDYGVLDPMGKTIEMSFRVSFEVPEETCLRDVRTHMADVRSRLRGLGRVSNVKLEVPKVVSPPDGLVDYLTQRRP